MDELREEYEKLKAFHKITEGALREERAWSAKQKEEISKKILEVLEIKMKFDALGEWSERITQATANMLNRGQGEEKIALRKCIDEWINKDLYCKEEQSHG